MADRKTLKPKKVAPKRPMGKVLQSVRQVMRITHVSEEEAIWQWGEPKSKALPEIIDVGIWNIWKGSGGEAFVSEYRRMLANCHLLLAQEALLTLKALAQFAPAGYLALHGATYRRKDGIRDGVMTVSAAHADGQPQRILCLAPEPLLNTTKASLVSTYRIENSEKVLCVVNIHATLLRRPATAVRELEQVLSYIGDHSGPILFAGDFNTFSKAYINEVDRVLSSIGLNRVLMEGDPRTTTTALDQIYVRDIQVLDARVDTTYQHSDHFPILAKLKLS
jgi:endonuclease/exonuclease/phosphatase (EEP) superfamily protein YafD